MKAKLIKENNFYKLIQNNTILAKISTNESINIHYSFGKLSLKNCQAIESGYDLDELADELHKNYPDWAPPVEHYDYTRGVIDGAKTLLEILGDKKFSEEDMMQLVKSSFYAGLSKGQGKNQDFNIDDYVKEHLQQTEWDVEIEMDILNEYDKPKFDAEGCLILKRKI